MTVHFTCADSLSGIVAGDCPEDDTLSTQGTDVSSTARTVSDKAGNVSDFSNVVTVNIDKTDPGINWAGDINGGDSFYFGSVPAAPTCAATDALSGPEDCAVTGYSVDVGTHTLTATAHDKAGNETKVERQYTVKAWTLSGFYQPVDMGGVWNIVKGGSTVPLKFEVFAANELTDVSVVDRFAVAKDLVPGLQRRGRDRNGHYRRHIAAIRLDCGPVHSELADAEGGRHLLPRDDVDRRRFEPLGEFQAEVAATGWRRSAQKAVRRRPLSERKFTTHVQGTLADTLTSTARHCVVGSEPRKLQFGCRPETRRFPPS